jgi:hypothetical protein
MMARRNNLAYLLWRRLRLKLTMWRYLAERRVCRGILLVGDWIDPPKERRCSSRQS